MFEEFKKLNALEFIGAVIIMMCIVLLILAAVGLVYNAIVSFI